MASCRPIYTFQLTGYASSKSNEKSNEKICLLFRASDSRHKNIYKLLSIFELIPYRGDGFKLRIQSLTNCLNTMTLTVSITYTQSMTNTCIKVIYGSHYYSGKYQV